MPQQKNGYRAAFALILSVQGLLIVVIINLFSRIADVVPRIAAIENSLWTAKDQASHVERTEERHTANAVRLSRLEEAVQILKEAKKE